MASRRKQIRDAALGLAMGRWVDEIEKALEDHLDLRRPPQDEAKDLLRTVIETVARKDLGDKVVFMDSNTFPLDLKDEEDVPDDDDPHLELRVAPPDDELPDLDFSGPIRLPEDLKKPEVAGQETGS